MVYGDETVISEFIKEQAKQAHSIQKEVEIDGVSYTFAERKFPPYFAMVLPTCFGPMKAEYARRKFPSEDRPSIILSDDTTTINFTFTIYAPSGENIKDLTDSCQAICKRLRPANVYFRKLIYDGPPEIGTFDYRSPALDGDIYNLWFYMDVQGSEQLGGMFLCPDESRMEWEPLAREMIQTLRLLPPEDEK